MDNQESSSRNPLKLGFIQKTLQQNFTTDSEWENSIAMQQKNMTSAYKKDVGWKFNMLPINRSWPFLRLSRMEVMLQKVTKPHKISFE